MRKLRYPNIAAERARKGMSLDDLGSAIGVTRKTINNWETKGHIPQDKLSAMADLFGTSTDYLLAN